MGGGGEGPWTGLYSGPWTTSLGGSMDRASVFSGHPCSVCVFISFRDCNWFRVLHAVDSLKFKHY